MRYGGGNRAWTSFRRSVYGEQGRQVCQDLFDSTESCCAKKSVKKERAGQFVVHGRNGQVREYGTYRMTRVQDPRKKRVGPDGSREPSAKWRSNGCNPIPALPVSTRLRSS